MFLRWSWIVWVSLGTLIRRCSNTVRIAGRETLTIARISIEGWAELVEAGEGNVCVVRHVLTVDAVLYDGIGPAPWLAPRNIR
ncbi:hypothetical protein BJ170DRAFT_619129 [Xylariales sp. AK1849]|nr:hypothetical protein BJ170DRAFT_619129 [Xylariales sp. AK1849]